MPPPYGGGGITEDLNLKPMSTQEIRKRKQASPQYVWWNAEFCDEKNVPEKSVWTELKRSGVIYS